MFKSLILEDLKKAVKDLSVENSDIVISIPKNSKFGDYTTNIALQLTKLNSENAKQSSEQIAKKIIQKIGKKEYLEKVELANGFINFYIKIETLAESIDKVCNYSAFVNPKMNLEDTNGQKIFLEYASFNALKPVHIGHLRNITLGESVSRLLEAANNEVFRATYTSDIGLPAAKVVWAILEFKDEFNEAKKKSLREKSEFLGRIYVKANTSYENDSEAKVKIDDINSKIYQRDEKFVPIWQEALSWTFEYYEFIYDLVGTKFDAQFLESEVEGPGSQIVKDNVGKVFRASEGAIIFPGEEFGLHNRVFITSAGNPTYEAKDMALAKVEYSAFPFEKAIHVVANDQDDYFKVIIKALGFLDPDLANKERHLSYGYVSLPSGKMSSRKGNVVTLEEIYDLVGQRVGEIVKRNKELSSEEKNDITRIVSLGAIKFAILKYGPQTNITFDLEKSVSLQGDSGPYIQYTYARAKSVLRTAIYNYQPTNAKHTLELEERELLRMIEHFHSIIEMAASEFKPNIIATFLLDFAKAFNLFYQKYPIIKAEEKTEFRLALTCAVAVVLKQGLYLLGIEAPERM